MSLEVYYNPSHVRTICKLQKLVGDKGLRFGVAFSDEAPEEPCKGSKVSLELYQELMKHNNTYLEKRFGMKFIWMVSITY